jgi:hypothetical protein
LGRTSTNCQKTCLFREEEKNGFYVAITNAFPMRYGKNAALKYTLIFPRSHTFRFQQTFFLFHNFRKPHQQIAFDSETEKKADLANRNSNSWKIYFSMAQTTHSPDADSIIFIEIFGYGFGQSVEFISGRQAKIALRQFYMLVFYRTVHS